MTMKRALSLVTLLALGAGVLLAQPQPGAGRWTTATTTSTSATSLTVGGGITAGTGAVALVNTAGKIPAVSSTYFADLSGANLTFAWTGVSFSGGNFVGSSSMTWTVDSGDVGTNSYLVTGSKVDWTLGLNTTSIGGTPNGELRVTLPGGFTATGTSTNGTCAITDNGTPGTGAWVASAGNTYVAIFKDLSAASWSASTNATSIRCMITFAK